MIGKGMQCACMAVALGVSPVLASAAPAHFSAAPATGKYQAAVGLDDAGRYAINSLPHGVPYALGSLSGSPSPGNIGSLGGNITRIRALNNQGVAVGDSTTASGDFHAFLYSSGRMQDLTERYGVAYVAAINDRGDIAGRTQDQRAMAIRDGRVDDFGPWPSTAIDMNGIGDVLVEHVADGVRFATAIQSQGTLTDLPHFAGAPVFGSAINDAGWVTGYGVNPGNRNHAYIYDGGTITNLTPSATNSFGNDINNLGEVVGSADNRAFLYSDGELIDLNTLIDPRADLLLTSAIAINDRTQILARSCDRAGSSCYGTVLLTPVPAVPEPSVLATLLLGLCPLGWRLRKRSTA